MQYFNCMLSIIKYCYMTYSVLAACYQYYAILLYYKHNLSCMLAIVFNSCEGLHVFKVFYSDSAAFLGIQIETLQD